MKICVVLCIYKKIFINLVNTCLPLLNVRIKSFWYMMSKATKLKTFLLKGMLKDLAI